MNDIPEEISPSISRSRIDESRRKRSRKILIPNGKSERALYLAEIAKRLVPGVEYFALSLAAGLVIAAGILLDSPAIFILGALLAPFMLPVVGLGFSTVIGSFGFFLRSIGALLTGSLLVFGSGALGGWLSKFFVDLPLAHARNFTDFSFPDFLLLTVGVVVAIYLTIRLPKQRSSVASVPLAYEIYIPVAVAGFGLTSGAAGFFPQALKIAAVYIAWVILVGTLTLLVLKLRPYTFFGLMLTAAIIGSAVYGLVVSSALGSSLQKQMAAFATRTPESTEIKAIFIPTETIMIETPFPDTETPTPTLDPTNTLVPSLTPTITITAKPTPVWAKVFSATYNGVVVRKTPGFTGEVIAYLMNEQLIQVLPEVQTVDGAIWAHVLLEDGAEGWIVRNLLITATPGVNW